jgi:hypothetical protein
MRWTKIALLGLSLLAMEGCGKKAEPPAPEAEAQSKPHGAVIMDAATQARMGVKVAVVTSGSAPELLSGYARVVDVGPLAAIGSELSSALAAATSSQEEYRRLKGLASQDQAASARSVEVAKAQAASDAARAGLAAHRIGLEWGASIEKMSDGARSALVGDIAAGRAAMLRIDAPGNSERVSRATVKLGKDVPAIPVTIMGVAVAADSKLQTTGLLGLVRGAAARDLPTGRLLQAELEIGATVEGFRIPGSALVRADSSVWVYMRTGGTSFARRDVGAGRAMADGWFVTEGFRPDEQIVVEGAGSLLAAEHGPAEPE